MSHLKYVENITRISAGFALFWGWQSKIKLCVRYIQGVPRRCTSVQTLGMVLPEQVQLLPLHSSVDVNGSLLSTGNPLPHSRVVLSEAVARCFNTGYLQWWSFYPAKFHLYLQYHLGGMQVSTYQTLHQLCQISPLLLPKDQEKQMFYQANKWLNR